MNLIERLFKKEEIKEKDDCKEQGHNYEVDHYIQIIDVEKKLNPLLGMALLLECKKCKKRIEISSSYGTSNEIVNLWLDNKISSEKRDFLIDYTDKKWEKFKKDKKKKTKNKK